MIRARCQKCGLDWGISLSRRIPKNGYICPKCERKENRETKDYRHRKRALVRFK